MPECHPLCDRLVSGRHSVDCSTGLTECCQADTWYDRSICPEPCGSQHQRCQSCGKSTDGCPLEVKPSEESPSYGSEGSSGTGSQETPERRSVANSGPYRPPSASKRPSWDDYFLRIAESVAARADCTRRKVGAVIVKNKRIVATGYNGAPAGMPGCLTHNACPRGRKSTEEVPSGSSYDTGAGSCIAIHAEANALLYADREHCEGATIYITCAPCDGCLKLIRGAGIAKTVYSD